MKPPEHSFKKMFRALMNMLRSELHWIGSRCDALRNLITDHERKLVDLQEILAREHAMVTGEEKEIMASLWTFVGGNKKRIDDNRDKMQLLGSMNMYRKSGMDVIAHTGRIATVLAKDLDQLQSRVAIPALKGTDLSMRAQLYSVGFGIRRLKEGYDAGQEKRTRAREEVLKRSRSPFHSIAKSLGLA